MKDFLNNMSTEIEIDKERPREAIIFEWKGKSALGYCSVLR